MVKCVTTPQQGGVLRKNGTRAYIHCPAFFQARTFRDVARQKMGDFEGIVRAKIIEKDLLQSKRFSSINFFLELREIGSMFKALDKYRYVDYSFGFAPFIDDLKTISDRFSESIESINARLDAYSRPVPLSEVRTFHVGGVIPFGAFPSTETYLFWEGEIKCSFKGTITAELPILSRYNRDYTQWLDRIGLHPDLATVWEAIPFSWFVDWFIPIGSNLESMSGTWLNPTLIFNGSSSCTYRISSMHKVHYQETLSFDNADYVEGQVVDTTFATGYIRSPLVNYALSPVRRKLELSLGLDRLSRIALLSDIFGPTKVDEKDRSTFKGRNKRRRNTAILSARKAINSLRIGF
jgi:hypothetical protein